MTSRRRDHDRPIPAHPYRDAAVVYGVMACVIVVVAFLTGGDLVQALMVALAFFVLATGWTWWRFRERIREAARAASARAAGQAAGGQAAAGPAAAGQAGAAATRPGAPEGNGARTGAPGSNGQGGSP